MPRRTGARQHDANGRLSGSRVGLLAGPRPLSPSPRSLWDDGSTTAAGMSSTWMVLAVCESARGWARWISVPVIYADRVNAVWLPRDERRACDNGEACKRLVAVHVHLIFTPPPTR